MRHLGTPAIRLVLAVVIAALVPACTADSTTNASPPTFGGLVSAAPGSNSGEITLTWNPAVDYAGGGITYVIYATNAGSGSESSATATTTNTTGFTLSGLVSSNTYWIIVQAEDSNGSSDGNSIERSAIAK